MDLNNVVVLDPDGKPYDADDLKMMHPDVVLELLKEQGHKLSRPLRAKNLNAAGGKSPDHTIYVLREGESEHYYVGRTGGEVTKRIKALQLGNPRELVLIEEYTPFTYREVLHVMRKVGMDWSQNSLTKEWYRFTDLELGSLKAQLAAGVIRGEDK